MSKPITMSARTRLNWLIDAGVFLSAVVAFLTGVYFLFLPVGGYQGGRNPTFGVTILFERHVWEDLHTWGGLAMVLIAAAHLLYHWQWVVTMTRRVLNRLRGQNVRMSRGAQINLLVDGVIALSFLLTAISGLYFLVDPAGVFLFSREAWDVIHTWAAVALIIAAMAHFLIHWKWITKVTTRFFRSLRARPAPRPTRSTRSA